MPITDMNDMTTLSTLSTIAERYRRDGYEVVFDPPSTALPRELDDYHPAFIAARGNQRVAVEIRTHQTLSAEPDLTRIAERIRQVPGWRLDLTVLGQESQRPVPPLLCREEVRERVCLADHVAKDRGDEPAALLLLWTAIEALLTPWLEEEDRDRLMKAGRLAKNAYSMGAFDEEYLPVLQDAADVRDDVVHGRKPAELSPGGYERVRAVVEILLNDEDRDKPPGFRAW